MMNAKGLLARLFQVQVLDLELDRLQATETNLPEDLREARNARDRINDELAESLDLIDAVRSKIERAQRELGDYQTKLSRAQDEQSKNANDPKAQVQYENHIQQLRDRISDIDEELTPLELNLLTLNEKKDDLKKQHRALDPVLNNLETMDDKRIDELRGEYLRKKTVRDQSVAELSKEDRRQVMEYEMLRKAYKGVGMVQMAGGRCSGCNMTLPVTIQQRIVAGKAPAAKCPSCGRLLVLKE